MTAMHAAVLIEAALLFVCCAPIVYSIWRSDVAYGKELKRKVELK